jgi:hypothetical protein
MPIKHKTTTAWRKESAIPQNGCWLNRYRAEKKYGDLPVPLYSSLLDNQVVEVVYPSGLTDLRVMDAPELSSWHLMCGEHTNAMMCACKTEHYKNRSDSGLYGTFQISVPRGKFYAFVHGLNDQGLCEILLSKTASCLMAGRVFPIGRATRHVSRGEIIDMMMEAVDLYCHRNPGSEICKSTWHKDLSAVDEASDAWEKMNVILHPRGLCSVCEISDPGNGWVDAAKWTKYAITDHADHIHITTR